MIEAFLQLTPSDSGRYSKVVQRAFPSPGLIGALVCNSFVRPDARARTRAAARPGFRCVELLTCASFGPFSAPFEALTAHA